VWWNLTKTALFTVFVPGTVAVWIPYRLRYSQENYLVLPAVQTTLGLGLFVMGAAIYLWCAWDFAVKGRGTPAPVDAPNKLVVGRLYRYSRNPMYVGVATMIAGQTIYYGSAAIAIYMVVVIALFSLFVMLYEEPVLRQKFGVQYDQYCRRVPRWIVPRRRA
jgi:protein-S-isoprenylcysteine O-methyltransferase Ste14